MFSLLLVSFVMIPVVLGILAARRKRPRGLLLLLVLFLSYSLAYLLMLYYLRLRWVG
jgi:hypothetical protein